MVAVLEIRWVLWDCFIPFLVAIKKRDRLNSEDDIDIMRRQLAAWMAGTTSLSGIAAGVTGKELEEVCDVRKE